MLREGRHETEFIEKIQIDFDLVCYRLFSFPFIIRNCKKRRQPQNTSEGHDPQSLLGG
jgi:hypothetical protein